MFSYSPTGVEQTAVRVNNNRGRGATVGRVDVI